MAKSLTPLLAWAHECQIKSFFNKWVKNYHDISNLGLFVSLPDKKNTLYISTHRQLAEIYVLKNFGRYDLILKEEMYKNYDLYPWKINKNNKFIEEINITREKIFKMNAGTSFVRKLKDNMKREYHVVFCISTYNLDPKMQYIYACQANEILEICDFAYNFFRPIFQNYTQFNLPKIENFVPVEIDNNVLKNYSVRSEYIEKIRDFVYELKIKSLNSHKMVMQINTLIEMKLKALNI